MLNHFIPSHRFYAYLTWPDIQTLPDKANTVIIQPIGAIEQHGPHLPLIVDAALTVGVLGRALTHLSLEIPAYSLPCLYYGKSNEHDGFPGTITLSAQTLLTLLMEIGESLYRSGFRKWMLLNGHGGQPQVLEMVARDLHQKYPDFWVFPFFLWRVPFDQTLFSPQELSQGIHAGDGETSLMLALLPDQVKMSQAIAEYPPALPSDSWLSLEGAFPYSWLTREISQSGVIGDPTPATPEKGDRLLQSLSQGWQRVIQEVYEFQAPQISQNVKD